MSRPWRRYINPLKKTGLNIYEVFEMMHHTLCTRPIHRNLYACICVCKYKTRRSNIIISGSISITLIGIKRYRYCRSQRLRSLRHEPSSPARTLGSWVRIPLEAWLSVCVHSVFVFFVCR
jgi:hypothetical protein